ncbi:MAG: S8 family serine peptidase [Bdellovibrionales bacterium]|nr:S8 family serine peptidase [Bdellovibrionales bacterium]
MSVSSLAGTLGGEIKRTINQDERLILIQRPMVETRATAIQTLSHNAMVEYAEPNYIYRVVGGAPDLPTDSRFSSLWGMKNTGGNYAGDAGTITGKAGIDIDAERAWKIETGSREVIVGVIDTGVNYRNPDLAANIFVNEAEMNGLPGVDDDGNGYIDDVNGYDFAKKDADPMDVYGHGTHVAGTIGAIPNADGVVGVAWNVRILPIRFLGDDGGGSLADAVSSIDYGVKMKAHILSNSWGGGGFSQALQDSIQRAQDAGVLFVAAAGNSSNDNDRSPEYPASYPLNNVISVAAIDPAGMMADFSNFGKTTVHLAAPGVNVLSYTMRGLESWSGTSMACPHVSGVAALLLSQDMSQPFSTIKNRLLASARTVSTMRGRVATGGMVNAYYALTNTVAPMDPDDPYNWQKDSQSASTTHPYAANTKQEFTFSVPGAKRVAIYFNNFDTEAGYDKVTFKDASGKTYGTLSGKLGQTFSPPIEGDTVIISFSSDDSVQSYGFEVGGVAYQ